MPLAADAFVDVAHVEHGLGGQQLQRAPRRPPPRRVILASRAGLPSRSSTSALSISATWALALLVAGLGLLLDRRAPLLEAVEIGEHQLGLDRLGVGDGIDAVLDMGDVVVLEAAHDIGDGVHLADVAEELVAEAFALRRAAHEPGDVDEGQPGRQDLRRLADRCQLVEPLVRHADLADIGLDGAERIVGRLRRRRLRQRVEEGRLADVRQSDDAAFKAHGLAPCEMQWAS